jgi:hypothetical protein
MHRQSLQYDRNVLESYYTGERPAASLDDRASGAPGGLEIELDPGGSMVAGVFLAANPPVYASADERRADARREKKVVEAHPFV